ncbi:MAG: hypothetical protein NTZ69_16095 [Bacteroidia bacterium]|nr:hypothetical protein [Bacteroidia bacterium]
MILHFNSTQLEVQVSDDSYRYQQIMGEHSLTLTFSLPTYIEIPVGAYCDFQGERYTLTKPQNIKKQHSRSLEYTVIMDASQSQLTKYKFKDTSTGKLKFWLTARPQEHLQMLVDNLNQRDSGWSVGDYVDAAEKLITYSHNFCDEALKMMAEAYNTEYEIVGKTIHLRRVEHNKTTPLPLSYGKGHGLKPGLGRTNFDNSKAIEILYIQGGSQNIDPSTYGATDLLLPKSQALTYEGRAYITDAEGLYIKRSDKALQTNEEDSLDCTHIYPRRTGAVTTAVVVDAEKNFYDFVDSSINFDYNQYLIAGETLTVIFQTGMLAGRELEVKYIHEVAGSKLAKRFELVPQEIDGVTMPNATFKPAVGDQYVAFGMKMPTEYICDNTNKTGASWDMYREAVKYLFENEDPRFSFTGEVDGIYAKTNWLAVGAKLVLGGFVLFSDEQFQITGVPIRIMGIKQLINNPYKPQIELSNVTAGQTVSAMLRKVETSETYTEAMSQSVVGFTKRRFRDAKETIDLLKKAQLHFTEAINPITVETMSLLVGDVSLQFRFVGAKLSQTVIGHSIIWDNNAKKLKVDAAWLQHMTLGIGSITKSHAPEEYKYWNLAYYESPFLEDQQVDGEMKSLAYYLYAHCTGDGITTNTATFVLSTTAQVSTDNDYYFLVGVLNSEYEDDRSFVTLYGYTEILPGRITSDRIVSTDGLNFLDFVKNSFRVGNTDKSLEWNRPVWNGSQYEGDGILRLKGTLVQSQSGAEELLGVFRGDYLSTNTYYQGDTAVYNGSTYKYIFATGSSTIPTNTTYWKLYAAQGVQGLNGAIETIYQAKANNTPPTTPSSVNTDGNVPTNWYAVPQTIGVSMPYEFFCVRTKTAGTWSAWSAPVISARYSIDGVDGTDYEYIYTRTTTNTQPATPATSQTNDYVPTGWTDDPSGVTSTYIYEWVCQRFKSGGTWSAFTTPALWAKFGLDGADGTDFENIFKRTTTNSAPATPATSQVNDFVPTGWTDDPVGVGATYLYEWCCSRTKTAGVWSTFSNSALWAKYGETGAQGVTGNFTEIRYQKNTSATVAPSLTVTQVAPTGWTIAMPTISSGEYVWLTSALKSADGNTLVSNWVAATRLTGVNGTNGTNGTDGTNGIDGQNGLSVFITYNDSYNIPSAPTGSGNTGGWHIAPTATSKWQSSKIAASVSAGSWGAPVPCKPPALVFRGDFVSGQTYYGNANSIDVVYYPSTATYYMVRADATSTIYTYPTNTDYWDTFGASFKSVATDLLFASMAYIDNLTTKYLNTGGTGQRVEIDGATGTMTFYNSSNVAVMTLADGHLTAVGTHLQNAVFESIDTLSTARLGIDYQTLLLEDDYGFSIQLDPWAAIFHKTSMSFYDAFQDYYNTTVGMDYLSSLTIRDSGGIARTILTSTYVKANMIHLRQLTTAEIATVPPFGIYVDTNGQHCAKDVHGNPHTLW